MLTGAGSASAPISPEEAVALFARWLEPSSGAIVLAVSGGPDSVALMHLAAIARHRLGERAAALHVATVDHGLRDGSADEAALVLAQAQTLGLPADILVWRGAKPRSRLQETARQARYDLLGGHAEVIGARTIMTAHTLDDQAETVFLRLLRGSGLHGLGAMRTETPLGGLILARPLLAISKTRLIATCRAWDWPFVEDPSNRNDRFARVRVRRVLAGLDVEGLSAERLARLASRLQRADDALEAEAQAAFARLRMPGQAAGVALDAAGFRHESEECRVRLLALVLVEANGKPPGAIALRLERIEALAGRLGMAIGAGQPLRTTCGGCRVILSQGRIVFLAEAPRQRGRNRDKASQ